MAYHRQSDLPLFLPNLELAKLFETKSLEPENLDSLSLDTLEALEKLLKYKENDYQLSISNYRSILRLLTEIEDAMSQLELKDARMSDAKLELITDEEQKQKFRMYKLHLNCPDDIPPEIEEGDFVLLRKMTETSRFKEFAIRKMKATFIEIRYCEATRRPLDTDCLYEAKFRKENTVYRMEQQAILTVPNQVIQYTLFPEECGKAADPSEKYNWLSEAVKTNPEQQQAVRNIVNGSAFPAPYILFGPPGTGKTTTLVEAIAQVWKNKPYSNILVCASSNFACNEILTRLMDLNCIPDSEMYRYMSRSQVPKVDKIDERVWKVSNIDQNYNYEYPDYDELTEYRLIFATLVTAGRIVLKGIDSGHFDYIFVDEAGSATEASTIIPIAGLVSNTIHLIGHQVGHKNHVVIAGDPKQLGPITSYGPTDELMYGRSLLERLMERDLYKPKGIAKKYNPACITKLLQNFRSHKNILDIPNKLFYGNELIAKAGPNVTNIALGQTFLPVPNIPIVFHAVKGETLQDADNPSSYNIEECELVLEYVSRIMEMELPQKEIGIISPYRRQCTEISNMLKSHLGLGNIEVGSVEQFQGQERSVIILSTVRSNTPTIGFLNNPKRLNVSITRAKALLVIVGNPKTLQRDNNWYDLIKYCVDLNLCTGIRFKLKVKPEHLALETSSDALIEDLCEMMKDVTINDETAEEPESAAGEIINISPYWREKYPEFFSDTLSSVSDDEDGLSDQLSLEASNTNLEKESFLSTIDEKEEMLLYDESLSLSDEQEMSLDDVNFETEEFLLYDDCATENDYYDDILSPDNEGFDWDSYGFA